MSERLEEVKERQYELINLLPHDLYLKVYWLYEQAEDEQEAKELVADEDYDRQLIAH